jgi:hypothetical protein
MIDLRRIRIGIEINDKLNVYEGLRVKVSGTKFANPLQNECDIVMDGLNQKTRDFILTETSPYNNNRQAKRVIIEVGRVNTGLFIVYVGDIISAEIASPPDVTLTIKAKTNNANAGKIVITNGQSTIKLSELARTVAANNDLNLNFQAQDKNIANYSFSGAAARQIDDLQRAGNVRAYVDDKNLIVKDHDKSTKGRRRMLSMSSGMVGIPKATEKGVEVSYLIDGESELGGQLTLDSKMNKSLNGDYTIDQLKFELASHDSPFFYHALCSRI